MGKRKRDDELNDKFLAPVDKKSRLQKTWQTLLLELNQWGNEDKIDSFREAFASALSEPKDIASLIQNSQKLLRSLLNEKKFEYVNTYIQMMQQKIERLSVKGVRGAMEQPSHLSLL